MMSPLKLITIIALKMSSFMEKFFAGTPVEAIENPEGFMSIPSDMIKNTNQHYALKVSGESMIDAGILDGDIAILEKTEFVKNGDIVVALIDSQEQLLKELEKNQTLLLWNLPIRILKLEFLVLSELQFKAS